MGWGGGPCLEVVRFDPLQMRPFPYDVGHLSCSKEMHVEHLRVGFFFWGGGEEMLVNESLYLTR